MSALRDAVREWVENLDGDFVAGVEAQKFCDKMRHDDADKFRAMLDDVAALVVTDLMGDFVRSERALSRRRSVFNEFADHVERADGKTSWLDSRYVIDETFTRRCLREMTRDDLEFAAVNYEQQANAAAFEAQFLRAVKRRVPKEKTVGDVFSDEQIQKLRAA